MSALMESNITKLVSELAKEKSEAVGVNSLNELKHIHADTSKLVADTSKLIEAESSMKKLIAKNADDNNKKIDDLSTLMASLLAATQNQTRLCAIQTLGKTLHTYGVHYLFPDFSTYYNLHSDLCEILITILKCFNKGEGLYTSSLGGRTPHNQNYLHQSSCRTQTISQPELQNYIIECIHQLTGMKPKIANTSDGKPALWRE